MNSSDDNLLDHACEGDAVAFGRLLVRHAAALCAHISKRIPERWRALLDADDVMQQTSVDAYLHIAQLSTRTESGFAAWLQRIADNNIGNAVRGFEAEKRGGNRQRVEMRSRDDSLASLLDLVAATQSTPSQHAAKREAFIELERAIERLPEDYRLVVKQFDLENRDVKEIARLLGRSPGAVYMIRARAHFRLGDLLGGASRLLLEA